MLLSIVGGLAHIGRPRVGGIGYPRLGLPTGPTWPRFRSADWARVLSSKTI